MVFLFLSFSKHCDWKKNEVLKQHIKSEMCLNFQERKRRDIKKFNCVQLILQLLMCFLMCWMHFVQATKENHLFTTIMHIICLICFWMRNCAHAQTALWLLCCYFFHYRIFHLFYFHFSWGCSFESHPIHTLTWVNDYHILEWSHICEV